MKRCILALILGAYSAGVSAAAVRYTYQGTDFSFIQAGVPSGVSHLSGYLQFDQILAPNLDQYQFSPTELEAMNYRFEFTDGVSVADNDDGGWVSFFPTGGGISTDSAGMITGWKFIVYDNNTLAVGFSDFSSSNQPGSAGDITTYCTSLIQNGCNSAWASTGLESSGAWTMSTVPVPAALYLFGSALGLLGWIRRKSV
jgi:hypothetical protein